MGIYDSSKGFNKIEGDSSLGDPEIIDALNKLHESEAKDELAPTLGELYHKRAQIENQMPKTFSPDRDELQKKLEDLNAKIQEMEAGNASEHAA